jgi:Tfp pilus assembly protein PilF
MRTRPLALALLLGLSPAMSEAPSWGQSSADDPTTAMARARFKEGVEFFDKGEFEQARASFLQAYALKKHPAVLLNLAWSCLKSGHALEAEHYFKQFLTESKDITDKQRADANDGLSQSHAKLGRIEVVAPAGTEITIDGDRAGVAPLADTVPVEAGAHTVKFKGPDGSIDTQSVSVLGGEKAVARLAKGAPGAAAPTTAAPPPPSGPPSGEAEPGPTAPATEEASKPAAERTHTKEAASIAASKTGAFGAPANMVPVYVGGAIALAGVGVAIGMYVGKQQAQDNADSTAMKIRSNGGTSCNPPTPPSLKGLSAACDSFVSSNNDVNTDATIGNIAMGIGIAAAAGTLVYWLVADKADSTHARARPVLSPIVGSSVGGLLLSGAL